jgi:cobalt-zinc-cadmium efflux system protein
MHAHSHAHARDSHGHGAAIGRAFAIGIALNVIFVLVEWVYGVLAGSLALIADATHNFSDVLGLAFAWGASALARKPPSTRFTYGLRGSTILAALGNAMLLLVVTGGIAWEAIRRIENPGEINGATMIWVATLGILINAGTTLLFRGARKTDLNARGAYLHMVADTGVSLGVVIAGVGTLFTRWTWLDPVASLLIVATIFIGTWGLLRDSLKLALHATPERIDPAAVRRYLSGLPGVTEVHDLHIWGMSTTETALTVHLVMLDGHPGDEFFAGVTRRIEHDFHIGHTTIQIETGGCSTPCVLAPEHVV